MPTLSEDAYCSEQICIPPSFPYLLRQYAKAAIRTQPTDLLKWSTAYFRCLSLNVPPPVKPRLEYPIPRDYNGITPGWLKALLCQLQNSLTVPFKVLWDRWIGACLHHHTLIQLLCLGGFEDADLIPFLKFIAICTGTLTDDLTHTMIMICEILTEEPEGGSAMIPLETFLDLYTFLARIDASHGQTLRNYYFRDSLLTLWKEREEQEEGKAFELQESSLEAQESTVTKTSSDTAVEGEMTNDIERVVSCPSLPEDDHKSTVFLLTQKEEIAARGVERREEEGEVYHEVEEVKKEGSVEEKSSMKEVTEDQQDAVGKHAEGKTVEGIEDKEPTGKQYGLVDTMLDQPVRDRELGSEDATLQESLERLRAQQTELVGETADKEERFDRHLIEEMPLPQSQEEGLCVHTDGEADHTQTNEKKPKVVAGEDAKNEDVNSKRREDVLEEKDERPYDDVYVELIKGIGPTVSTSLTKPVIAYMTNCAKQQHGMVTPRNITHYSCPPLEDLDY